MSQHDEVTSPSPSQMALDLHPFLASIEAIASEHGLSHDSGVSFGMSSRKRQALQQQQGLRGSASSSSLKRIATVADDAKEEAFVTESPTATSTFDAKEDVWRDVGRRLKPFGDTLRHERLRTTLGQTKLSDDCVHILNYSCQQDGSHSAAMHEAQIELLRTMANLCIDNDENRQILLQHKGPQAIIAVMRALLLSEAQELPMSEINLLRTATGALLNMQLDHVETRNALRQDREAMQTLLLLATDVRIYTLGEWYTGSTSTVSSNGKQKVSTGANIVAWSWRIVQDVCTVDVKEEDQENTRMVEEKKEGEEERSIESLVAIGADKAAHYLISPLKALIAGEGRPTVKGPWTADDVSDLMESDLEVIQIATELLESCAIDSKQFRLSSLPSTLHFLTQFLDQASPPRAWSTDREESDALPPIPSDVESAKEALRGFTRAKAAVAKAIVIIAGEDENMSALFETTKNWFMDVLKDWMGRDAKERDDLVSTAMLAMGNLARRDSHCLALVHKHDLVPTLTALLSPSADIKVAHGIICLLKNLSLPPDNKLIIGHQYNALSLLSPYLSPEMDRVQPLQFATVGLLKHLCANCVQNAVQFVSSGDIFDSLLQLVQRTEDIPTRMEGTRVLVNVTKTLWSGTADADSLSVRQKMVSSPVAMALAEMVRSSPKYPVLVNEGILAMTLIASEREKNGAALVAAALLSDPAMEELNALTSASEVGGEASSPGGAQDVSVPAPPTTSKAGHPSRKPSLAETKKGAQKLRSPSRKTTMDSLASQNSQPLPSPRTSADMIANVLARRDARMPPQFASNACVFIQTLIDGSSQQATPTVSSAPSPPLPSPSTSPREGNDDDDAAIKQVLQSWLRALHRLSEVGPQETIAIAKKSLKSTNEYLAMA